MFLCHKQSVLRLQVGLEGLGHFLDELDCGQVFISWDVCGVQNGDCQILSHKAVLNCLDHWVFKSLCEFPQSFIVVKLSSVQKTTSPSKDTGDRVGRCFFSLLVKSVVSGYCSVSSFSFDRSIGGHKNRGHQTEWTITWIIKELPWARQSDWTSPS